MKAPSIFTQKLWELAASIPRGFVTTYGDLAKAAGGTGQASRSVSGILGKAPPEYVIPWHRIVYAGGKVWINEQCAPSRMKQYREEGIEVNGKGKIINFEEVRYYFR